VSDQVPQGSTEERESAPNDLPAVERRGKPRPRVVTMSRRIRTQLPAGRAQTSPRAAARGEGRPPTGENRMMWLAHCAPQARIAALDTSITPSRFVSICAWKSSMLVSSSGPRFPWAGTIRNDVVFRLVSPNPASRPSPPKDYRDPAGITRESTPARSPLSTLTANSRAW
jgi:hypothetical protein